MTNGTKSSNHFHIWSLPKKYFPKTKGSSAKEYATDVVRLLRGISYTETQLRRSAVIAIFYIKSAEGRAKHMTKMSEVMSATEDFVYHYENYCNRIFALRERILRFINAILPVGYSDNEVKIEHLIINPIIKKTGLLREIKRFSAPDVLGLFIQDRNALTHKLYYGAEIDHYLRPIPPALQKLNNKERSEWFRSWRNQIDIRVARVIKGMSAIADLNHGISDKIVKYKNGVEKF